MKYIKLNKVVVLFILFFILYSSISLVNHYFYRTSALDMGVFNHALYNYSHFKISYFTLGLSDKETGIIECFGNHFSPVFILLSPVYFVFGKYSLLLLQIGFVLIGGLGIYKYAKLITRRHTLLFLFVFHFFSIWGIYSALAFDFHLNVLAAMLVPWLFYFYKKENLGYLTLVFILMLLTKESTSLWLVFILCGLLVNNRVKPFKGNSIIVMVMIVVAALYFFVSVHYIMPLFVPYESAGQFSWYSNIGANTQELFINIFTKPLNTINLLFNSPFDEAIYTHIKTELHVMVLVAGGALLFFRPAYLLMLIPIYFQKLLTNQYAFWGINYHYSIEFVPILSLLVIDFVTNIKSEKKSVQLISIILGFTIASTLFTLYQREALWYDKTKSNFLSKSHYTPDLDIKKIRASITKIQKNESVSAHFRLAPHLAFREKIYHFPVVKDASYIVLLKNTPDCYPLSEKEYLEKIQELKNNSDYMIWEENEAIIIFKKSR